MRNIGINVWLIHLAQKGMFEMIQRQGSSINLMPFLNDDGPIAKAWSFCSLDGDEKLMLGR